MTGAPEGVERRYTPTGRYAHYVDTVQAFAARYGRALCGRWPHWEWLGTGSQAEYDRAAELPLCSRCARAAA